MKFCAVGGSGYVVNLAVFTLSVEVAGLHHLLAATAAFAVAVTNNFWWNRHWTFGAREGHAGFQAARFFAGERGGVRVRRRDPRAAGEWRGDGRDPAQAISIVAATPLNFVGNKMWSFGRRSGD